VRALTASVSVGLSVIVAGCGSGGPKTSLRIQVGGENGVRAYRLHCDPARGTAPHPDQICHALQQHSNLLLGGKGFDHSCPSSAGTMITGLYRGHSVNALFGNCAWIPGQGNAQDEWVRLLQDASKAAPTTVSFRSVPEHKPRGWLVRRRKLLRRETRLRAETAQLLRQRTAALAAGKLRPVPGKPDALTLHIFQDFVRETGLPDGPFPTEARVYSNRRRYVLVLRFDYVDYTGTKHRAPGGMTFGLSPTSLRTSTWSVGTLPSLAGLAPGTTLPL